MPSSPAPTAASSARYGLAAPSTVLSSTLAELERVVRDPGIMRNGASRFSMPQIVYAPAQCPGWSRR